MILSRRQVLLTLASIAVMRPRAAPLAPPCRDLPIAVDVLLSTVNALRPRDAPLLWDAVLAERALNKARSMARCDFVSHTTPPPCPAFDAGNGAVGELECIAAGQRDTAELVAAWLASPSHRAALLDPHWTQAGAGGVYLADDPGDYRNQWYWALQLRHTTGLASAHHREGLADK